MSIIIKKKRIKNIIVLIIAVMLVMGMTSPVSAAISPSSMLARSSVAYCVENNQFVCSEDMNVRRDPWSTTKLLTVLLAMENLDLDDTVTISKETAKVAETQIYLKAGEKIKVRDLIYASLLPSANDAAAALGQAVSGNRAAFAKLMNKRAKELGCKNSHFVSAHGCLDKNHYSTAYDILIIARECFKYDFVRKVIATPEYTIPATNKHRARHFESTNDFITKSYYQGYGVLGGKTGTWDPDNAALVTLCRRDGVTMYTVILHSDYWHRFPDTITLLDYAYKHTSPKTTISEIKAHSGNEVTLKWIKQKTAQSYKVYMKSDGDKKYKPAETVTGTSCIIKGLEYNTVYRFKVKAVNDAGKGRYSASESVKTGGIIERILAAVKKFFG